MNEQGLKSFKIFILLANEIVKPKGKLTLKDIGISSPDYIDCLELVYKLGTQYEKRQNTSIQLP